MTTWFSSIEEKQYCVSIQIDIMKFNLPSDELN